MTRGVRRLVTVSLVLAISATLINFVPSVGWRLAIAAMIGFPPPIPGVIEESVLSHLVGIILAVPSDATLLQWTFGWAFTFLMCFAAFIAAAVSRIPENAPEDIRFTPAERKGATVALVVVTLITFIGYDALLHSEFVLLAGPSVIISRAVYAMMIALCALVLQEFTSRRWAQVLIR